MTDLEMTRRCAEAIGFIPYYDQDNPSNRELIQFAPLHDDAQAMALDGYLLGEGVGFAFSPYHACFYWQSSATEIFRMVDDMTKAENRRRARVECVAKMQAHV